MDWLKFSFNTTMVIFIIVCVFMMLLVLIQKGRGGGLSSAFGGAGGNTAFGSKTGDVLTWATSIVFGIFLLLAIALNLMANRISPPAPSTVKGATTPMVPPAGAPPADPVPVTPNPIQTAKENLGLKPTTGPSTSPSLSPTTQP